MANRKKRKRHVPTDHKLAAKFTKPSGKKKYRMIQSVLDSPSN